MYCPVLVEELLQHLVHQFSSAVGEQPLQRESSLCLFSPNEGDEFVRYLILAPKQMDEHHVRTGVDGCLKISATTERFVHDERHVTHPQIHHVIAVAIHRALEWSSRHLSFHAAITYFICEQSDCLKQQAVVFER